MYNIAMDLMVLKYRFAKEIYIKQINDIQKWTTEFGRKRSCLKRISGYDTRGVGGGEGEVEVDTLLLCDDKSNVIANKL